MDNNQTLAALKKLSPVIDGENSLYYISPFALNKWQEDVLPLLVFNMSLYNKFKEHSTHAISAAIELFLTTSYRDDKTRKAHIDVMVNTYYEAINKLENLPIGIDSNKNIVVSIFHFCKINFMNIIIVIADIISVIYLLFTVYTHFHPYNSNPAGKSSGMFNSCAGR